jgi:ketosteroid isomerase-like protein
MRSTGDVKAWAASFASDADYFDSLGHLSKGRENIEQRFQGLLSGPLQQ